MNKIKSSSVTYSICLWIILLCAFLSAFWTVLPLLGWSYYSPEGIKMSCGIEWQDHSLNVISYNTTVFVFAFFIPLFILAFTNWKIIKNVIFNFILSFNLFSTLFSYLFESSKHLTQLI